MCPIPVGFLTGLIHPAFSFPLAAAWWALPEDLSARGGEIDSLYYAIFCITGVAFLAVQGTLVFFLVKYRQRQNSPRAAYTRGSAKLEAAWAAGPSAILLALSVWSTAAWDRVRYSPELLDPRAAHAPHAAHVLIIARQFNWNAIYAGPDENLGRYLVFPKPTDPLWPRDWRGRDVIVPVSVDGKLVRGRGPAALPRAAAMAAINRYTAPGITSPTQNEFGKVFDPAVCPEGADDVINNPVNRVELPVNRPTILEITSLDVIHDFYLPNFRVNAYAVPGMTIRLALTPTMTSDENAARTRRVYAIDDLPAALADPETRELSIDINASSPGSPDLKDEQSGVWRYYLIDPAGNRETIIRDGARLSLATVAKLKRLGIDRVTAHLPGYWEIICAQLCGNLHTAMHGQLYVLTQEQWAKKYESPRASR
jgi:heme/copper-type cytochrome/quinol oxidase subunit 2